MRELTVRRAGVRLAVRTFGRSGPHLILVHGLASTQHIWDVAIPRLERRFRVTTYDQRGHGASSRPSSGYDFASTTADLAAVAKAVGAGRPVVAGHSYGANVAIELGVRRPRSVAGIVCVDGGMGSMSEIMSWPEAHVRLAPPPLTGVHIDEIVAMAKGELGRRWSPDMQSIVRSLFFIDRQGRVKPCLSRANHMRILRAMYHQKPKELLARIAVPTLMYCARPRPHVMDEEGDFYAMKKRAVAEIKGANSNVEIEWITSIHDIPVDRPRELADRLARFTRAAVKPAGAAKRRAPRPRTATTRRASPRSRA